MSEIEKLCDTWDALGTDDPLWAAVSYPERRHGKWDAEEFFRHGTVRVDELMGRASELGFPKSHRTALDFGCGAGRLSQALASHFDSVIGIDLAPSMIELARKLDRSGRKCTYLVNSTPDLRNFRDGQFDCVMSELVLRHVPRETALHYIREFVRVLSPIGLCEFQIPSGPLSPLLRRVPSRLLDSGLNTARRWKGRLRRDDVAAWETHWIAPDAIREAVSLGGGRVVRVVPEQPIGGKLENFAYFLVKN